MQNSRERYIIEMYTNHGATMHHITTPIGLTSFPSDQLIAVLAYVRFLISQNIKYTHYFEE